MSADASAAGRDGEEPPVRLLYRRVAYTNQVWKVCLDHVRDANGHEIPDYLTITVHDPRPDLFTGSAVLPIVEGRLGLLRSFRHPIASYVWEAPRGFVDPGEELAAAALRELGEEAGLACAPDTLLPLGFVYPEAATVSARTALFVAQDCTSLEAARVSEFGIGDLSLFSPDEVRRMLCDGEISEAITLVLLYRYFALV